MKSLLLACSVIVLHNKHDSRSREFVKHLPNNFPLSCVVDWYGSASDRFQYEGPPPSAFPSIAVRTTNQEWGLVRTPQSLEHALSPNAGDFESLSPTGNFVGGLQIWEAEHFVKWGYPTHEEEIAILGALSRLGRPVPPKSLALARSRRPVFAKTPGHQECEKIIPNEWESWRRLAQISQCLAESANTQLAQISTMNLAERDPKRLAQELAEIAKKKELSDYLRQLTTRKSFNGLAVVP